MIDEVGLGQVGQAGELLNMGSAQIAQLAAYPMVSSSNRIVNADQAWKSFTA